jgi:molybdenum cofactor guanylyltransferase
VHRRFLSVTGFVLAGGESRRMGTPKQLLVLDRQTMLDRQLRLLRQVCGAAAVVGEQTTAPDGSPAFSDIHPVRGPLGGIHAGLVYSRTEYNLFISCDLPFLRSNFLEYLCERAIESGADATIPRTSDQCFQPVCAVYRRRIRRIIQWSLEAGNGKITRVFPQMRCEFLDSSELAKKGFSSAMFVNMNSPADYQAARRRIEGLNYL